ncbi:MAG: GHKL domain-containing protein [Roseivirga sp.]|nr:GHKL domain-containing protein [Roseivirga sp.]
MVSKRFALLVIIRIVLLMLTLTALAFIFAKTELFFNQIILVSVIIIQVSELIRFITYTNRELAKLLLAIRYSDFSISFKGKKRGKSFQELQEAFVEIIDAFKKVSVEKEAQFKFLKVIVDHINVGIIAIKEDYEIELMNQSATDTLKVTVPNYWKQFQQLLPHFAEEITHMDDNERKLMELNIKGDSLQISVHLTKIKILSYRYNIITFQDIKSEIEQKEIEAWHKLIRILTHEIMNSVTPITSLSETMLMLLQTEEKQQKPISEVTEEDMEDLTFSLNTIQKRSEGLLHFVDDYRRLTKIKQLELEKLPVKAVIEDITNLLQSEFKRDNIALQIDIHSDFEIAIDEKLIAQVLINLLTNARHAVEDEESPMVYIKAYYEERNKIIEIRDNGCGIEPQKMDQIFIPFFSTKEQGSGIGLSLSKQIMKKHKGDLRVRSEQGQGASFFLVFRY